jgi:DNA-binding Lrp family transcriptional regulator
MQYEHRLDMQIISRIEKQGRCTFNELKKKTGTNSRTLTVHLNALEDAGILVRKIEKVKPSSSFDSPPEVELVDGRFIGIKRYCYLTEAAKFERKLGVFEGIVSNREKRSKTDNRDDEESQERKRKKLLLLVLWMGSTGATRSRPKPKAEPGDIPIYDEKEGRFVAHELYTVPGFGVSDFLDEKNKRFLGQTGALTYIKFPKRELEKFFEKLSKLKMIKPIDEIGGEKRYGLKDRNLGDFLSDCWSLFSFVQYGLEAKWRYLKRPTRSEYDWYRFFYGDRGARLYFTKLLEESKSLSKREEPFRTLGIAHWDSKKRKEYFTFHGKKTLEEMHNAAKRQRASIDRKYKAIIDRYSPIAKPLIDQICSPIV